MLKELNLSRLWLALALLAFSFAVGVGGFMMLENYSFIDAFYMTVITASTVGFGEVHPLSDTGRIFVSFYILFNLLVVAYLVSVLTTYIFDGELRHLFRMIRADQEIKSFRDHVIVCGFGRNGYKAYDELRHSGTRAVVVEQNEAMLRAVNDAGGTGGQQIPAVYGDATLDATLRQAGIEHARALITALPKDADNVFVALTARELNPHVLIIARASARSSVSKLLSAGANSVVMPDEIGGSHMANLIIRPEVIRFLDMISGLDPNKLRLEELSFSEMRPSVRGQSIRELDVRSRTGATVIALRRGQGGELEVSPAADYRPAAGDVLLVLGNEAQIQAVHKQYK
ncbi:potassium channel protein [Hymenobacter arcticus]